MATVPIYPTSPALAAQPQSCPNPLPKLLHTPAGIALLEIQGTINLPDHGIGDSAIDQDFNGHGIPHETPIGRLVFPDYHPETQDTNSPAWMKRVYLYVGKHQRLTGEVKKLPKAIAVIRKRSVEEVKSGHGLAEKPGQEMTEELEIVEIVRWKILFSQRPEPVGTRDGES